MKTTCEVCECALPPDGEAYVCSFECTFCQQCAASVRHICPNCGGELLRRPRRQTLTIHANARQPVDSGISAWLIWAISFAVWSVVAFAGTLTIFKLYRTTDTPMRFSSTLGWEFCQVLTYAPLTPFAFAFAIRFPLRRDNWPKRSLLYLVAGLVFTAAHLALKGITPFAYWDNAHRHFASAVWDSQAHVFKIAWGVLQKQFLSSVVDDITGTFIPIALVAHAILYYQRFRERERRAAQLEGQLAKAHLQTLKSQLQPHFLFNTMHSISSLMLTDVQAADRMMTRLGDLLRMSLESAGTQITTLSGELEFLNCYLEIEKVRFAERLNVTMDIAPEALDAAVPHLLLQPIVDNAVKHGISKLPAGGKIRITVTAIDGELQFEIKDNGPGFGREGVFPTGGLGLRITRERLESLYGQDQSVELLSAPGGGTVTRICIPLSLEADKRRPESPNLLLHHTA
jgi:signal transduction histidine kinase